MGTRLTLKVLPKTIAKDLWLETDSEKIWSVIYNDLEKIVYDFCTDAMLDILYKTKPKPNGLKRVTRNKLSFEEDCYIGKMDKGGFKVFTDTVKSYAEKVINKGLPWSWNYIEPSEEKWVLCNSLDWISAYYMCLYIDKLMDWNDNYIFFELG